MAQKRLFWGWFVVISAFGVLAVNYGSRYTFGVFLPVFAAEYGWHPSFLSLSASLNILVYACGSVVVGRFSDSIAPRWLVTSGALLLATSFLLLPLLDAPFLFCLVYGVLGGLGASGMGVVVCASSVGKWFIKKRGLATGIATTGIGMGAALLIPLVGVLEAELGWRLALFFIGLFIICMAVIPAQIFLRTTYPEEIALHPDGAAGAAGEAAGDIELPEESSLRHHVPSNESLSASFGFIARREFLLIATSFALAVLVMMTIFVHVVAYALVCGIEKRLAALALGFLSLSGVAGQICFGWISDRLRHPRNASLVGFLIMAIGVLILLVARDFAGFAIFAVVFGFGYGSLAPLAPILTARVFGRERMGTLHGLITLFLGVGGALGPVLAALLLHATGTYAAVWLALCFALLISAFSIHFLEDEKELTPNNR